MKPNSASHSNRLRRPATPKPGALKPAAEKLTVVGSFAVGLTLRAPRFPVAGETLIGSDFDMGPGGKGSNQAIAISRLGVESHLVAKVGTDMFGDMAVSLYEREGVFTEHLLRTDKRNTGVGFITLNEKGENHIVIDPGANLLLTPDDVDAAEELIAGSEAVLSVLEIRAETAGRAMELARRHGVLSILNPAPATYLTDSILAQVDILTPNESELRILCGLEPDDRSDSIDLVHRLQDHGVGRVVLTQGSEGALIVDEGGHAEKVEGFKVDVSDTTGAGDSFNAALAASMARGKNLSEAVRFATYAGAFTCTQLGVIQGLPFPEDIEKLIEAERSG